MRVPSDVLKHTLAARVLRYGSRLGDGSTGIYSQNDIGALMTVVVNRSDDNCRFTLDHEGSLGLVYTRQTLLTKDVVPSQCAQIVNVGVPITGQWRGTSKYRWQHGSMKERHAPGIFSKGLHDPIKLSDITV